MFPSRNLWLRQTFDHTYPLSHKTRLPGGREALGTPDFFSFSLCSEPMPSFLLVWQYLGISLTKGLSTDDSWTGEVIFSWGFTFGRNFLKFYKAPKININWWFSRILKKEIFKIIVKQIWPQLKTQRGNLDRHRDAFLKAKLHYFLFHCKKMSLFNMTF